MRLDAPPPLGYLPQGTTNDFASSLQIPRTPASAAKNIVQNRMRELDIGRWNERSFIYVASFGAFTRSSYAASQAAKNALGHFAYILEGMKDLNTLRPYHIRLTADGEVLDGDYLFGAVCNSTSIGGLMKLDPERVVLDDGKFEMLLVPSPKTAADLQNLVLALLNQQYDSQGLVFRHVSSLRLETEEGPGPGRRVCPQRAGGGHCQSTAGAEDAVMRDLEHLRRRYADHVPGLGARHSCPSSVPGGAAGRPAPALRGPLRRPAPPAREVCFPGGPDGGGETPEQCALRETEEELAIPRQEVEVLGRPDFICNQAGFLMQPVLGLVSAAGFAAVAPSPAEVGEAFTVPLAFFRETAPEQYVYALQPDVPGDFPYETVGIPADYRWARGRVEVPIWYWQGHAVWGMTARLTQDIVRHLE